MRAEVADRLGIDIGSKTLKLVLLDAGGQVVCESYVRHRSKVQKTLVEAVHDCVWRFGDREVELHVTGSAGMRVAQLLSVPFVQEVVALKRAVESCGIHADAVLEMGGEDSKLVYLSGAPEQRMNAVCAGGTGGFIDLMASLMGKRPCDMNKLALGANTIYPIASRCAVFARSDVRPLLAAGARKEDVAASVLEAVCTQAVAGLSAGRPLAGTVVLLGGPFQHIPALRDAFCKVAGIDAAHAIVPDGAHLLVARGAAISPEPCAPVLLSKLEAAVRAADFSEADGIGRLPALFSSKGAYEEFSARHAGCRIPRGDLADKGGGDDVFLGIDAGSTTMKMVLVDISGAMLSWQYDWNEGDVAKSFPRMLGRMYRAMNSPWAPQKTVRRACVVGYGEDFCRAAFGVDMGEVETVAHLRAALELEPDVDFLVDVGGQDVKCFYVHDGRIDDIVVNEACSAGCGSLFDAVARSMRCTKEAFSSEALFAERPVDLGCRCTTFMESRVKHAQKEGAFRGDIAAGVVWACARNILFKVVRRPGFPHAGTHVMVQGGAFANDALLRAFELECGVEAARPDRAELMGAWGAALLARDAWQDMRDAGTGADEGACAQAGCGVHAGAGGGLDGACDAGAGAGAGAGGGEGEGGEARSGLLDADQLDALRIVRRATRCVACENRCKLMVSRFSQKDGAKGAQATRVFVTGNRCEKGARIEAADARAGGEAISGMRAGGEGAGGADALGGEGAGAGIPEGGEPAARETRPARAVPPNMVKLKNALIARCDASGRGQEADAGEKGTSRCAARLAIGVPKALALYESYPFWAAFFKALGCRLVAGAASSEELYRAHTGAVCVEGACYPSKLLLVHAAELARKGAELVFVPNMGLAFSRAALLGEALPDALVECPLVERAGTMLADNADAVLGKARLAAPDLSGMRTWGEAAGAVRASLADAGLCVGAEELEEAFACGQAVYRAFFSELAHRSAEIAARARAGGFPVALLAGHPYHADPGICHGVDGLLSSMGYAVLEQGACGMDDAPSGGPGSALVAGLAGAPPRSPAVLSKLPDAQLVIMRSFGCGADAMRADDAHAALRRAGYPFAELKVDQIVDLAAMRIRLRSLAYAARMRRGKLPDAGEGAGGASVEPARLPACASVSHPALASGDASDAHASMPRFAPVPEDAPRVPAPADAGGVLLVPGVFGPLDEKVARLMQARGFTVRLLPEVGEEDMEAGLALVDNDVCNIAIALVGHYARALACPDAPKGCMLLAPELCHECRQVTLPGLLRGAMERAGHAPVRLIPFSTAELRGVCPAPTPPADTGDSADADARPVADACPAAGAGTDARPVIGICGNAATLMNTMFTKTVVSCLEGEGFRVLAPPLCDITCERDFLGPAMDFFEARGVRDAICVAPFGCLGAHVFARAALRRMQRLHPGIELSVFDYDFSASAVNLENRVLLVAQNAREKARPRA